MNQPNLVRIVAAFVAGVVIALGSALIYLRVSETIHRQPVALAQDSSDAPVATQLPDVGSEPAPDQSAAKIATETPDTPPTTAPIAENQPSTPIRHLERRQTKTTFRTPIAVTPRKQRPKIALAQLVVNRTPVEEPIPDTPPQQSSPEESQPPAAEAPPAVDLVPLREPHMITLQAGTAIPIRLSETLSTDHNYTGDTFRGTLAEPIIMDGFIIADRGSKVLGRIVNSEKPGRVEGLANLNLTLTEINTTDGQCVHIDTNSWDRRGPSTNGEDAAKIAGVAALGALIGAVAGGGKGAAIGAGIGGAAGTSAVFATRGKPVNLPVETKLTFRLAAPLTITEKLN